MFTTQRQWWIVCVIGGICFLGMNAYAQDSPLQVHAYVFSIQGDTIKEILKDGLTRDELTTLQGQYFQSGCMLPEEKPVELKEGENKVRVPIEGMEKLHAAKESGVVVFIYDIKRNNLDVTDAATITRRTCILAKKDDEIEELRVKKGTWRMPEDVPSYRFMDYRHAANFKHDGFSYELNLEIGDLSQKMNLILELSE